MEIFFLSHEIFCINSRFSPVDIFGYYMSKKSAQ